MREHDDAWLTVHRRSSRTVPRWLPDGSALLWWSERDGDGRVRAGVGQGRRALDVWLTPTRDPGRSSILDVDTARRVATLEMTRDGLHYEVARRAARRRRADDAREDRRRDRASDLRRVARRLPDLRGLPVGRAPRHGALGRREDRARGAVGRRDAAGARTSRWRTSGPTACTSRWCARTATCRARATRSSTRRTRARTCRPSRSTTAGCCSRSGWPTRRAPSSSRVDAKGTPGRGPGVGAGARGQARRRAARGSRAGHQGARRRAPGDRRLARGRLRVVVRRVLLGARGAAPARRVHGCRGDRARDRLAQLRHRVHRAVHGPARRAEGRLRRLVGRGGGRDAAVARARSPLLLIAHGTADDNVYFFNSLQLVDALAKAGRSFRFLPFLGQTHQFASPEAQAAVWSAAAEALQKGLGPAK